VSPEPAALLAARLAAVPSVLAETLEQAEGDTRPDLAWVRGLSGRELRRPVVTTGIGASEGPARVLAWLLQHVVGLRAGFRPLSQLLAESPRRESALLVLFSQGLSPNAQLALALAPRFHKLLVYTSVRPDAAVVGRPEAATPSTPSPRPPERPAERSVERSAERSTSLAIRLAAAIRDGALVAVLPPTPPTVEDQLFLRVLGPAAATLAAVQLAAAWAAQRGAAPGWPTAQVPAAVARAFAEARTRCALFAGSLVERRLLPADEVRTNGLGALFAALPGLPIALLTTAGYGELCHGLRLAFVEGAGLREPALWDVLGFAHGPLQQAFHQPTLLLGLRRPAEAAAPLWSRLRRVLAGQHMLLELPATLPAPLSLLEHQVQIGALVLEALRVVDWDLLRWPGQGQDQLLYGLRDPSELSASMQLPALPNSDESEG
jgi:creatinine amidohydrolase